MQAVVLVGGLGTRLRPLTLDLPKQMLPVAGVTMIERVVSLLAAAGIDEVVLSLGYRPEIFTEAFPADRCAGVELRYAVEPEPLGTAGAIAFAADFAGISERFLALNGDVLTDLDLQGLCDRHAETGAAATVALTPVEDPSRYGVVPLDADGRVEAFIEKPDPGTAPSNWINAGYYVVEPEVLDLVPRGAMVSIEREVFPRIVEERRLFGVQSDAYWIDAGTPEAYLQANLDYLDGRRGVEVEGIDASVAIDRGARVSRSVLGRGCVVGADAVVTDSVLLDGVRVGAGTVVDHSIVGTGAQVGDGCTVGDLSVIGPDADLPAGSSIDGTLVPGPDEWEMA